MDPISREEHHNLLSFALKEGATDCPGNCGMSENACREHHQVVWAGTSREGRPDETVWVEGTTSGIADLIISAYAAAGLVLVRREESL